MGNTCTSDRHDDLLTYRLPLPPCAYDLRPNSRHVISASIGSLHDSAENLCNASLIF